MPHSATSMARASVRWPFRPRDVFYRVTEPDHRLAVIHSLPGMLVWPILLIAIAYLSLIHI